MGNNASTSAGVSVGSAIAGGILAIFTGGASIPVTMAISGISGVTCVVQAAQGNHGTANDVVDGMLMGVTRTAESNAHRILPKD